MAESVLLTATQLKAHAGLFHDFERVLALELSGLDNKGRCELAFSRLTKPDTFRLFGIERGPDVPFMLGTDQRDYLVPPLAERLTALSPGATVLDVGAGSGRTTACALAGRRESLRIIPLDPSAGALDAYETLFSTTVPQVSIPRKIPAGLDEMVTAEPGSACAVCEPLDMVIAIHSLYFTAKPVRYLHFVHDRLAPGGKAVVVFAGAAETFSLRLTHRYWERFPETRPAWGRVPPDKLDRLFGVSGQTGDPDACQAALDSHLGVHRFRVVQSVKQPTRVFGNSFGDLLATGFANGLGSDDPDHLMHQIRYISSCLQEDPETFDLRLTLSGARARMLSIAQPQFFIELEKTS